MPPPEPQKPRQRLASTSNTLSGLIDRAGIEQLKKEFVSEGGDDGLSVEQFVRAFGEVLGGRSEKELMLLFWKIDANSDGSVDWDEFTNFILNEGKMKATGGMIPQAAAADELTVTPDGVSTGSVSFVRWRPRGGRRAGQRPNDTGRRKRHARATIKADPQKGGKRQPTREELTDIRARLRRALRKEASVAARRHPGSEEEHADALSPSVFGASGSGHTHRHRHATRPDADAVVIRPRPHTDMISAIHALPLSAAHGGAHEAYVTGSRDGMVQVWNEHSLLPLRCVQHSRVESGAWVTGLTHLPLANALAVASSDRRVDFYDPLSLNLVSRIRNTGTHRHLAHSPTCLDAPVLHGTDQLLLIGDDGGNVLIYNIKSADDWHLCDGRPGLSTCKHGEEGIPKLHWRNVALSRLVGLHADWVTRVRYEARLGLLLTSSLDGTIKQCDISRIGFVVNDSEARADGGTDASSTQAPSSSGASYVRRTFSLHEGRGVHSFAYSAAHKFVSSCGQARHVLVWDPFTCKLICRLEGHMTAIEHIAIDDRRSILTTVSSDRVLKIWDVRMMRCIQTVSSATSPSRPENRVTASMYSTRSGRFLLGTNKLTVWQCMESDGHGHQHVTARAESDDESTKTKKKKKEAADGGHTEDPDAHAQASLLPALEADRAANLLRSHDFSVVGALYNENFNQIVSADTQGFVSVWDMDTGAHISRFHVGSTSLTYICFDANKRRLLTGTHSGKLCMWNFSNGSVLCDFEVPAKKRMHDQGVDRAEVTGIEFIREGASTNKDLRYLIRVGWDRQVTVWREKVGQPVQMPMFSMPLRRHMASKVAAGTSTGHTDDILCVCVCGPRLVATGGYDGRICLWHFDIGHLKGVLMHPVEHVPVNERAIEKLVWLPHKKILISSGADGFLRFWDPKSNAALLCMYGGHLHGENILVLRANESETRLLTGDSAGYIQVWDMEDLCILKKKGAEGAATASRESLRSLRLWRVAAVSLSCADFVPQYKLIITSSVDGNVMVSSQETGRRVGLLGNASWDVSDASTWLDDADVRDARAEWNRLEFAVPVEVEERMVRATLPSGLCSDDAKGRRGSMDSDASRADAARAVLGQVEPEEDAAAAAVAPSPSPVPTPAALPEPTTRDWQTIPLDELDPWEVMKQLDIAGEAPSASLPAAASSQVHARSSRTGDLLERRDAMLEQRRAGHRATKLRAYPVASVPYASAKYFE